MPYSEDEFLMISGLQHLAFCPRQCALIHMEQAWAENVLTALGEVMHDRVHTAGAESRSDVRIVRGLRLKSARLGITGVADVVEFHKVNPSASEDGANRPFTANQGVKLPKRSGLWVPYPVEYKRGKPKPDNCDAVQLCAQAICLEEAFNVQLTSGALFYGQSRQRVAVEFTPELRRETESLALQFHQLISSGVIPPPVPQKRCQNCSMVDVCLPSAGGNVQQWVDSMVEKNLKERIS